MAVSMLLKVVRDAAGQQRHALELRRLLQFFLQPSVRCVIVPENGHDAGVAAVVGVAIGVAFTARTYCADPVRVPGLHLSR